MTSCQSLQCFLFMVKCIWCIHKWGCGSNVCDWAIGGTGWCHNQDEIICNLLFHHSNLCSLSDTILFLCRHTNPHCPFTAICRDTYYPKLYLYSTLLHSCSLVVPSRAGSPPWPHLRKSEIAPYSDTPVALCSSASSEHWSCMGRPNLLPGCIRFSCCSPTVFHVCFSFRAQYKR